MEQHEKIQILLESAAINAKKLSEHELIQYMEAYAQNGVLVVPINGKTKEEILKTVSKFVK